MNEHTRRILAPKTKPVKDRDVLKAFADSHHYCQLCGDWRKSRHIHHIIGGRGGRSDETCNLLTVCYDPCHPFCDLASNLGVVLYVKHLEDGLTPEDLERLEVLNGKTPPEFAAIPDEFALQYRRNRGERSK